MGETDSELNGISDNTPLRGADIYLVDSDGESNIFSPWYSSIPEWNLALTRTGDLLTQGTSHQGEGPEGYLRRLDLQQGYCDKKRKYTMV